MRVASLLRGPLVLALALHIHHRFHGPPFDYAGLAVASAASWIGVPGPGEPVLIAAGFYAAKNQLDIATVLVAAWVGATAGGIGGWLIGTKAGRRFMTAPGPLLRLRRSLVARGDEVFARFTVLAILLTPSWIAGIHRVRAAVYLPTNAAGAAAWAVGIGLGAYYVGPPIVDIVGDLGAFAGIALASLIAGVVGTGIVRQRRQRRRRRALESELR